MSELHPSYGSDAISAPVLCGVYLAGERAQAGLRTPDVT